MSMSISEGFGGLGIRITKPQIASLERFVTHFLIRGTHPLTFNGIALGVHPIAFTTSDYNTLFNIFDVHERDIEQVIRKIPSINRSFKVTSSPFNLLVMWLVHLAPIYIKDPKICHGFMMNLLRIYHYRIFCSVVNNSFKHGTHAEIMDAMISSLNLKWDIVRYESWQKLMETHCEKILNPKDRFYSYLTMASPDDMFLRVIGESQSALRAKLVTFAQAYYDAYTSGKAIQSKSSIVETKEGERIIAQSASVIDSATHAMISEVLNPNSLVNDGHVHDVAKSFQTISPRMLKTALLRINETAVLQTGSRSFDKIVVTKDHKQYVGIRPLMLEIIRSMVRLGRERGINIAQHAEIFKEMRNIYASSRSTDADILNIKYSVGQLVDSFKITSNTASQSALRLAVIQYILYRTLLKMK